MEHILQIAVGVDDEAIQKKIEDAAVREIQKQVDEYGKYRYGYDSSKLTELFKEEIKKIIEVNKDVIIERAIDTLAKNIMKTKKVKSAVDAILNEVEND